jgi:hypothetical protein
MTQTKENAIGVAGGVAENTAYWPNLALNTSSSSDSAPLLNISMTMVELPS